MQEKYTIDNAFWKYDIYDRKKRMAVRVSRFSTEGRDFFDQPIADAFPSYISMQVFLNLGIFKASDLIGLSLESEPGFKLMSAGARKAVLDYSWYMRFRLKGYSEPDSPGWRAYNDQHPSVMEYCMNLMQRAPKKTERIVSYLNGMDAKEAAACCGCSPCDIYDALMSFRRDLDIPWVYEDKYFLAFDLPPEKDEFFSLFPESSISSYRYLMLFFRKNGRFASLKK